VKKAKTGLGGLDYYKNKGLKQLIVHVAGKSHQALSSLARREGRSLQIVARAILEQASKEPEKALKAIGAFMKAGAKR
jgi:hypothetical protein